MNCSHGIFGTIFWEKFPHFPHSGLPITYCTLLMYCNLIGLRDFVCKKNDVSRSKIISWNWHASRDKWWFGPEKRVNLDVIIHAQRVRLSPKRETRAWHTFWPASTWASLGSMKLAKMPSSCLHCPTWVFYISKYVSIGF